MLTLLELRLLLISTVPGNKVNCLELQLVIEYYSCALLVQYVGSIIVLTRCWLAAVI